MRDFPEYQRAYQDHLNAYGEMLGHVFFCEINSTLSDLLRLNQDKAQI